MSNEFVIKKGLIVQGGQSQITGTLRVQGSITSSLYGTASVAISASSALFSLSSSYSRISATSSLANNLPNHQVLVKKPNGSLTFYGGASSDTERGNLFSQAIGSSTAGSTVVLTGDTFEVTGAVSIPSGVTVQGAGKYVTRITSNVGLGDSILVPSSNCTISDLSIVDLQNADYCFPIRTNTSVDSLVIKNIYISGYTDCLFFEDLTPTFTSSIYVYDSILESNWDHLVFGCKSGSIYIYDTQFNGVYDGVNSHRAVLASLGYVHLFDCKIFVSGSGASGIEVSNASDTGSVRVYGGFIENPTGTALAIANNGINELGVTSNTIYNTSSVVGSLTYLDRDGLRDSYGDVTSASHALFADTASYATVAQTVIGTIDTASYLKVPANGNFWEVYASGSDLVFSFV